jgi:hypothetical protein
MFLGVEHSWCVGLATLPPFVSQLSRQYGMLNISQPYRPPQPVTGIALIVVSKLNGSVSYVHAKNDVWCMLRFCSCSWWLFTYNGLWEPSMGTSHRLPKPVSRKQLDKQNYRVTNNRNSTGNVTSHFYIGFASRDQQKYRRKTSQSARCPQPVNTYISSSAVRVFVQHVL